MARSIAPYLHAVLRLFRIGRADDRWVQDVALRVGHRMRQVRRLDLVESVVVRIRNFGTDCLAAFAAGRALLVHEARTEPYGDGIVAARSADTYHFRQRQHAHVAIGLETPQVDLQAAGRMAHLREVAVEQRGATAQGRTAFDEHDLPAAFSGLQSSGHATDAAAHHQNGLARCDRHLHRTSTDLATFTPKGTGRRHRQRASPPPIARLSAKRYTH